MDEAEFRQRLDQLQMTKAHLWRLVLALGGTSKPATIKRRMERWGKPSPGEPDDVRPVPDEVIALLTLLDRYPRLLAELRPLMAAPARELAA